MLVCCQVGSWQLPKVRKGKQGKQEVQQNGGQRARESENGKNGGSLFSYPLRFRPGASVDVIKISLLCPVMIGLMAKIGLGVLQDQCAINPQ